MFIDMGPEVALKLPEYSKVYEEVIKTPFLPEGVPELGSRLKGSKTFREFKMKTYAAYS